MSNGSQIPQILIVGAGAMGLGAGYHLHLAKAAITFLVRPATADGLLEIWSSLEQAALPLDFAGFNKFHHGGKVRAQDIELLNDCVKVGEQQCQPMSALKELLARVQTFGPPLRVQSAAKS